MLKLDFSKALIENFMIIGLTAYDLGNEALSPFNIVSPRSRDKFTAESFLPSDLQPTAL
jgi:hypothetical protein